jgi:hypothetical protein
MGGDDGAMRDGFNSEPILLTRLPRIAAYVNRVGFRKLRSYPEGTGPNLQTTPYILVKGSIRQKRPRGSTWCRGEAPGTSRSVG